MKILGILAAAVIVYFATYGVAHGKYEQQQSRQASANAVGLVTGSRSYAYEVISDDEIKEKSRNIGFVVAGAFVMLATLFASLPKEQQK